MIRFLDWCFRDRRSGAIVVAQWPNLWLWVFAAASLVDVAVASAGPVGIAARITSSVFLAIWAGDEVVRGVNPWRRCLGAGVLVWMVAKLVV